MDFAGERNKTSQIYLCRLIVDMYDTVVVPIGGAVHIPGTHYVRRYYASEGKKVASWYDAKGDNCRSLA